MNTVSPSRNALFQADGASPAEAPGGVPVGDDLPRVALSSWGWSLQGARTDNQDSFLNWPERRCWAVADGVGGSDHGAEASRLLVKALLQLPTASSLEVHIRNARARLEEANELLASRLLLRGSAASTIVALLMHEGRAACLWSGDSRCYLLRGGVLYQCTRDHTLRQEKIDKGELTAPEAYRMIKGNIITNAIGGNSVAKIDEVRFSLRPGDRLLLCSDGLTNLLSGERLTKLLEQGNARQCAEHIRDTLGDCAKPDDVTLVTVFLSLGV